MKSLYKKTPLYCIAVVLMLSLQGCLKTLPQCHNRDYCQERDGPRQYVRAPEGWGGKYCLQNPTEC